MREILFRGFHKEENGKQKVFVNGEWINGEWIEGYYIRYGYTGKEKDYIVPDYASDLYAIEVIPETVGQYTGLTDKNSTKIFEGDILATPCYIGAVMDVVEYKNGSFVRNHGRRNNPYLQNGGLSKIIGNIHDNPELLDGADNG